MDTISSKQINRLISYRMSKKKRNRFAQNLTWVLKTNLQSHFFTFFTIFVILAILCLSFISDWRYSINTIKNQLAELSNALVTLLESDPKQLEAEIDRVENSLLQNIEPVLGFAGLEPVVRAKFAPAKDVAKKWVEVLQQLQKYELTNQGFVNPKNANDLFTDDLELVLEKMEAELLPQTKKAWQGVEFYLGLAELAGVERAGYLRDLAWATIDFAEKAIQHKAAVLELLGHNNMQKIVVFNQNVGEGRPTGGFIGSYISIDMKKGRLNVTESNSIYHPDKSIPDRLYMHPATAYYGWFRDMYAANDHGIRNANFLPCFSETAKTVYDGFQLSPHGYHIDQIVFITPQILLDILGPDFELEVQGVGTFTSSNIMDEIERITGIDYEDKSNPKKRMKDILEALMAQLPNIAKQRGSVDWLSLFIRSVNARDVQIWSSGEEVQTFLESSGLANQAMCNSSQVPEVGFLLGNISADKRNLVSENQFNIYARETRVGTQVYVKYKQILPEKPDLQRGFNRRNSFTFVGLQLPPEATHLGVTSPQAIHFPFVRPYYEEIIERTKKADLEKFPEIAYMVRTSRELYSSDGSPPGFVYKHLNGSQVVGVYINDSDTVAEVEFSFLLPPGTDSLKFYGQPGLQKPSLGLGQGVKIYGDRQKVVEDHYKIPAGVYLELE